MADLVCYECGKRYYSAAALARLEGALTCDPPCGAPLFEILAPPSPEVLDVEAREEVA